MSILRSGRHALALLVGAVALTGYLHAADADAPAPKADATKPAAEPTAEPAPDPKAMVAKVGDHVITQADVDAYVDKIIGAQLAQVKAMNPKFEVPKATIDRQRRAMASGAVPDVVRQYLVDQKLLSVADKVSDADVEKSYNEYKDFLKTQGRDLKETLDMVGKSEDGLKFEFRRQLELEKVLAAECGLKLPTEDEIKDFFTQHKDDMAIRESVHARHILISFPGDARDPNHEEPSAEVKSEKKKVANEVLAKLKGGGDFAKLAAQYSGDPSNKDNGGDLGSFQRGKMVPSFEQAAFSAKPGDVVGPVETPFGYHIIKVEDHTNTKVLTLDQAHYQLREYLVTGQKRELYLKLVSKLQNENKITLASGEKLSDPVEEAANAPRRMRAPVAPPAGK